MTDLLGDHIAEILEFFRQRTGVAHWVGTVGIGVCVSGHEYLDEPAMAVMLGEFSARISSKFFPACVRPRDLEVKRFMCGEPPADFAIVHADPRNSEVPELIAGLAGKLESGFCRRRAHELAASRTRKSPTR